MSYSLVLLPFASLRNIKPGQLTGSGMIVDSAFVPFVHQADAAAGQAGLTMLVNQAFRRAGQPVEDARVPPASNSQHLIGRALDANLLENGRMWGSGLSDPASAISPAASPAVAQFLDLMRRAGFRWGGAWTPPDRVHWDAWVDPQGAEYQAKYRLFQNQDVSGMASSGVLPSAAPPVVAQAAGGDEPRMPSTGGPDLSTPSWLTQDVGRHAAWLPQAVRTLGIAGAYAQRWSTLPADIQAIITGMNIPPWMIALVPTDAAVQDEIFKQFRFMVTLAGDPPRGAVARRAEQLLMFGGCAQLPTPGDSKTGVSLGAEGCTAAMSKYILAQLKREYPAELAWMSDALTTSQYSPQMLSLLQKAGAQGYVQIVTRPFAALRPADILPGSLMVAQKPGGTHVFGWTRVAAGWNWDPGDKMAIGNTGLAQFGDRMILAQEYVTDHPEKAGELIHNEHGPINSTNVVYAGGKPDLSNPRTNVYAVQASSFILVNLVTPAAVA